MTSVDELRRQKYNATVAKLHLAHSDLMMVRVRPDAPRPPHKPGQYTVLGLGYWEPRIEGCQPELLHEGQPDKLARRSYSISCPILEDDGATLLDASRADWLEFYIVLVRDTGSPEAPALTPRLFMLQEGSRLYMGEKITGSFTLEGVKDDDTVLFLSTGTGEAPHNYMLWELLRRGHRGRILSACCVRYKRDLGYLATHEALMKRYPNYTYLPMTTREPGQTSKAYIQDVIINGELERLVGKPLAPDSTHVFLCGNPAMIGIPEKDPATGEMAYPKVPGVIELMTKRGFQMDRPAQKFRGNIHFEKYW